MSKYVIDDTTLTAIGDAVREKGETTESILVSELADQIKALPNKVMIESLEITENGTYEAPEGTDGYNPITVKIPWNFTFGSPTNPLYIKNGIFYMPGGAGLNSSNLLAQVDKALRALNIEPYWTFHVKPFNYGEDLMGFVCTTDISALNATVVYYPESTEDEEGNVTYGALTLVPELFYSNSKLKEFNGTITNWIPAAQSESCYYFASYNPYLKHLPKLINCDLYSYHGTTSSSYLMYWAFSNNYALREIPIEWSNILRMTTGTSLMWANSTRTKEQFQNNVSLESLEVPPFYAPGKTLSSAMTFNCAFPRLNSFVFVPLPNSKNFYYTGGVTVDTSTSGWGYYLGQTQGTLPSYYKTYTDITLDDEVYDEESYEKNKDNPNWYTTMVEYSRYNHDSAVETINSLYQIQSGYYATIQFDSAAGSKTDGGAIGDLTEEEIAVATDKGWTVTLV